LNKRWLALPGTLLCAAFLAACSSDPGPLGSTADYGSGVQCQGLLRPGQMIAIGDWELKNGSASTVTVQSASLPGEHGLSATKAWLVPIQGQTLIGVAYWPPKSPMWPLRQPAAGAVIRPHQSVNLVFGFAKTSAKNGQAGGPLVTYTANGHTYTLQETFSVLLEAKACGT
jgi:hypothetical protein